ncbi:MAG: uncharacterized protein QOH05_1758 [Acetobacteraceae bacterium]|nr:uncharacterized protein [Acetobacteraceae bacterium]
MFRVASVCVAAVLAAWAPAASASLTPAGGPVLPQSPKPSISYAEWNDLIHKALDGDATSATEIGKMYAYGTNARQDIPEAMRWLSRGADLGANEARRELGLLLLRGNGTPKDPEHAALLLRQAAESGDAEAEAALGVMYAYGDGLSQDWVLAIGPVGAQGSRGGRRRGGGYAGICHHDRTRWHVRSRGGCDLADTGGAERPRGRMAGARHRLLPGRGEQADAPRA